MPSGSRSNPPCSSAKLTAFHGSAGIPNDPLKVTTDSAMPNDPLNISSQSSVPQPIDTIADASMAAADTSNPFVGEMMSTAPAVAMYSPD